MTNADIDVEQIRSFRLHGHHLDTFGSLNDVSAMAGACGLQNSPPGAWEAALYNRIPDCSLQTMEQYLYTDKTLLQAWSMRGAPVVFPADLSSTFLLALCPKPGEPWIYTNGIQLALDFLQLPFDELLDMLKQVLPGLNGQSIVSKTTLDQTLAAWMLPLLPAAKRDLWEQPSMYGSPDKQTVGGAVVSFLLRPCAFMGLVVFGRREGIYPTFTSYKSWTGQPLREDAQAASNLVRSFLHCYGPATPDAFASWLGCSGKQGRRLWSEVSPEMEPVTVLGKKAYILSSDRQRLCASPEFPRELLLLAGHDPYLDQRDRLILQPDKALHRSIWKMVGNPGAIVLRGEIIGLWTPRKKAGGIHIQMTVWKTAVERQKLLELAESYAAFRQQKLINVEF